MASKIRPAIFKILDDPNDNELYFPIHKFLKITETQIALVKSEMHTLELKMIEIKKIINNFSKWLDSEKLDE